MDEHERQVLVDAGWSEDDLETVESLAGHNRRKALQAEEQSAKQENVGSAAAASEGGGSTIGSERMELDDVSQELRMLYRQPQTGENRQRIADLREAQRQALSEVSGPDQIRSLYKK